MCDGAKLFNLFILDPEMEFYTICCMDLNLKIRLMEFILWPRLSI